MTHQSSANRNVLKLCAIWPSHTYKKWRLHGESLRIDLVFTGTQTWKCFNEEIKSVHAPMHQLSFVVLKGVPRLCKRSKLLPHRQNVWSFYRGASFTLRSLLQWHSWNCSLANDVQAPTNEAEKTPKAIYHDKIVKKERTKFWENPVLLAAIGSRISFHRMSSGGRDPLAPLLSPFPGYSSSSPSEPWGSSGRLRPHGAPSPAALPRPARPRALMSPARERAALHTGAPPLPP